MLELRPNCEHCDRDLPPESADAMICTFECTFCKHCVESEYKGICPNCGGNFAPRPIRPSDALARHPASEYASTRADMSAYSVYLVRCRDGSHYTGIATDVARRVTEHEDGAKGAKYLRGKGPLNLVYQREIGDRSLASKIESRVKRLSKAEKTDLESLAERINGFLLELRQ